MPRGPVLEFTDPVFAKTSPKRSFLMTENGRFGLVFVKSGCVIRARGMSGVEQIRCRPICSNVNKTKFRWKIVSPMDKLTIKTPNPKWLFLKLDL
jgi:hypothetical protein